MTEIALVRQYPKADTVSVKSPTPNFILCVLCPYLHCNLSIIDQDLSRQEIGADCSLVTRAELLVDLESKISWLVRSCDGLDSSFKRRLGAYILVHQAGLADTTISKDNNLSRRYQYNFHSKQTLSDLPTLRRTFFRADMLDYRRREARSMTLSEALKRNIAASACPARPIRRND